MSEKGRILLAEDTPANVHLFETILTRAGYDVVVAEDGAIAVDRAKAERFDVILMDLGLPLIDGFEATQRIRTSDAASATTPIMALTADDDAKTRRACAVIGIVGFIAKPVAPGELTEMIAAAIAAGPQT